MKTIKWLYLFFLILSFSKLSIAKEYPMLHYTIENGLASNTIYDIYQDPNGIIWIGTDKGISRFNGLKFENFTTADGLSDNECFFFQPDYEGRLWIGTYNGKLCFYKDGVFHNEQNTPWLKLKINASHTISINLNSDSSLIFTFQDAPAFLEVKKEKIITRTDNFMKKRYTELGEHKGSLILFVKKIKGDDFKIYYYDGIYTHLKNKKSFKYYNNKVGMQKGYRSKNKFILLSGNGNFYDTYSDTVINISKNGKIISTLNDLLMLDDNNIYATLNGLYIDNELIKQGKFNSIASDNYGNFWAGTSNNGVVLFNFHSEKFNEISSSLIKNISFSSIIKNKLFFITQDKAIYTIDIPLKNIKNIHKDKPNNGFLNDNTFCNLIQENSLYSFNSGSMFSLKNINEKRYNKINYKLNKPKIFWQPKKISSSDEYIYMRCAGQIAIIKKTDLKYPSQVIKPKIIPIKRKLFDLKRDSKNQIWTSSINEMYIIRNDSLANQPQFKNLSLREFIFSKQYLLGITHQNQLVICNNYNQNKISVDTVFANNCVWDKFYTLNDSTLLLSTNNFFRIISLKPSKNKAIYQLRVIENPIIPYQPDFVYADSNEIYFFKKNQIKSFPTSYVLKENPLPTIQFSYLKTNQDKIFIKDTLVLDYRQSRDLKVLFTPISYYHQKLIYEYSISEKNEKAKWSSFEGEELNLIKIGYGKFSIKVRVKTLSGDYSSPAKFILIVNKPFWATWWFIGFCLLLIIAIAATVARIGIKLKLKKKEGEVRFLRSEYKAMNALMNPHFIFNSLNSVQSLVNNNENSTASRYIRIFSDLIRQNMRNIAQELIPLSKELDLVENYLKIEKLRFKDKLNFSIHIDEDIETDLIFVPPLLIQPLVENAIKHGIWPKKTDDGFIKIYLFEKENILHIEISDNGSGFNSNAPSDTMHESYAMSNIYTRIEQLSKMHQTKIECHIAEIKNENVLILGVKSEIIIHLQ